MRKVAGKVNKIAKVLVRIVASEGLQPMVTEAFLKDSDQCEMDAVKETNEGWKSRIVMITVFNIIGFAAMTLSSSGSTNTLRHYVQI